MKNLRDLTAVILAGGLGTRLRSVVADRPKVLAEVGKKPFLTYVLDQLVQVGIRHVVICIGYLGEQVRKYFGDRYGPLELEYSHEDEPMGTGGALRLGLSTLRTDHVLVMNGDSICVSDLGEFWNWHQGKGSKASILLVRCSDVSRYGKVEVDHNGIITEFIEKQEKRGPGWISAGAYLIARSWIQDIPVGRFVSIEREVFPSWVGRGIYGFQSKGRLLDIGTPDSYALAEAFLLEKVKVCSFGGKGGSYSLQSRGGEAL